MKFCIGIVLYYPTKEELLELKEKISFFQNVVIFDNTDYENQNNLIENKSLIMNDVSTYISYKKNMGLSYAYNTMCTWGTDNGFDFLLILDQDSIFVNDDIKRMVTFIEKFEGRERIGIFSPAVLFEHMKNQTPKEEFEEKEWVISSGSFINLDIYHLTQGFDNFLFIDRVDDDYCRMIRRAGYKIIQYNLVILNQTLGTTKKIFGRKISEHSAMRVYYMSRNRLYIYNKYYRLPKRIILSISSTVNHVSRIVIYESNKTEKLLALTKGIKDFWNYKFIKGRQ